MLNSLDASLVTKRQILLNAMARLSWILFWFVCLFVAAPAFAQTHLDTPHASLAGVVIDKSNQDSLPGVHLFLVGTSYGATTDARGSFTLDHIPLGTREIGISIIGYETRVIRVEFTDTTQVYREIELTPEVYELGKVVVSDKRNRRWRKRLKKFTRYFIGESENADATSILNPEVLSFKERLGVLIATASQDLIIENKALGYRIYYTLFDFLLQDNQPRYRGVARYESLTPVDEQKAALWQRNRVNAYQGSLTHFLQVLFDAQSMADLNNHGFFLTRLNRLSRDRSTRLNRPTHITLDEIISLTNKPFEKNLRFSDYLRIEYVNESETARYFKRFGSGGQKRSNQHSYLQLTTPSTLLNQQGFIYESYDMVIYGYMGHERVGDAVPLDFRPN